MVINMKSNMDKKLLQKIDNFQRYEHVKSVLLYGDKSKIENPFVTIAIPTYKRGALLIEAIDSAINQMDVCCKYEVIIVDNETAKNNDTFQMISKYEDEKVLYYKNETNIGMFGNWNKCIELARGKWVALLHDDDLLKPNYINIIVKLINRKKNIGAIITNYDIIDNTNYNTVNQIKVKKRITENKLIRLLPKESIMWNANIYNAPTCGTIFLKQYALEEGGFNEDYYPSADWFFFFKFNHKYKVYRTFAVLGSYRIFMNESQNPDTLRKFVSDTVFFRKMNNKQSMIGNMICRLFDKEQHAEALRWMGNMSQQSCFNSKMYNDLVPYTKRPFRLFIYKNLKKCYNIMKKINGILFG